MSPAQLLFRWRPLYPLVVLLDFGKFDEMAHEIEKRKQETTKPSVAHISSRLELFRPEFPDTNSPPNEPSSGASFKCQPESPLVISSSDFGKFDELAHNIGENNEGNRRARVSRLLTWIPRRRSLN